MQLKVTRLPSDDRTYSIVTGSGTRYGIKDFELKRVLLDFGVGDSTIAVVLDTDPNETMTLEVADKAA